MQRYGYFLIPGIYRLSRSYSPWPQIKPRIEFFDSCWLVGPFARPLHRIGPRDNNLSLLETGKDKRLISQHKFIEGASKPNATERIAGTSKSS